MNSRTFAGTRRLPGIDVVMPLEDGNARVFHVQVHLEAGMAGHHLASDLGQVMSAKLVRRRDAQSALHLRSPGGGLGRDLAQLRQRPRDVAIEGLAGFGQAQAARRAVEQARAQLLLQPGDGGAQAGLGPVERARGRGEAAVLHDLAESVEVVPVHCSGFRTQKPAPPVDRGVATAYDCPIQNRLSRLRPGEAMFLKNCWYVAA